MDDSEQLEVARMLGDARHALEQIASYFGAYLRLTCERLCRESRPDFRYRGIECRVKEFPSVVRALSISGRGPAEIWNIDDVVGARVVVVTRSDIEPLVAAIMNDQGAPARFNRVDLQDPLGYRAVHLKGWYQRSEGPVSCEIQIRSGLDNIWALVSREGLYGHEVPEMVAEMARSQAAALDGAERALDLIRKEATRVRFPVTPELVPEAE